MNICHMRSQNASAWGRVRASKNWSRHEHLVFSRTIYELGKPFRVFKTTFSQVVLELCPVFSVTFFSSFLYHFVPLYDLESSCNRRLRVVISMRGLRVSVKCSCKSWHIKPVDNINLRRISVASRRSIILLL